MIPECALQNIAHPHRNPQPGESVSFRKTYTPPVRGKADESSAHTSAPNSVRMPAATHTERTPPTLGTCRLISEGCTKTDAPMMISTTIAVACSRPIGRSKAGRFPGAVKMRQCTTALEPPPPVTRFPAARRVISRDQHDTLDCCLLSLCTSHRSG